MQERKRLLLVDDDPNIAWSVGRYLTRAKYQVTTCGSGAEARDLLVQKQFDLLVTDIQMPKQNGLELIEWIRLNRPDLPIVVMTAFGSPALRQLCLQKGALLYLEKPFDPKLLVEISNTWQARESFSGVVDGIDILDYVQLLLITKRKAVVEIISTENQRGVLYIDNGCITHAKVGEREGEEAFYHCMEFTGGRFSTLAWQEPERVSIDKRGDFLILEGARIKDEASQLAEQA